MMCIVTVILYFKILSILTEFNYTIWISDPVTVHVTGPVTVLISSLLVLEQLLDDGGAQVPLPGHKRCHHILLEPSPAARHETRGCHLLDCLSQPVRQSSLRAGARVGARGTPRPRSRSPGRQQIVSCPLSLGSSPCSSGD